MALKKSELYSSLWSSCDELRGGMDASQYKDYVLVLLFIKYVSDKYAGQPFAQYGKLSEADVKALVVDDKWLATVETDIQGEMDRISQTLTQRVNELAQRYGKPPPVLAEQVDAMESKVRTHQERMGFAGE